MGVGAVRACTLDAGRAMWVGGARWALPLHSELLGMRAGTGRVSAVRLAGHARAHGGGTVCARGMCELAMVRVLE